MRVYVDTSVILRIVLGEGEVLRSWNDMEEWASSELLAVEVRRTLDRLRIERHLNLEGSARATAAFDALLVGMVNLRVVPGILVAASRSMALPVKTLDAIHIASAELLREADGYEDLVFATHDVQQAAAARAVGFDCIGV